MLNLSGSRHSHPTHIHLHVSKDGGVGEGAKPPTSSLVFHCRCTCEEKMNWRRNKRRDSEEDGRERDLREKLCTDKKWGVEPKVGVAPQNFFFFSIGCALRALLSASSLTKSYPHSLCIQHEKRFTYKTVLHIIP